MWWHGDAITSEICNRTIKGRQLYNFIKLNISVIWMPTGTTANPQGRKIPGQEHQNMRYR